MSDWLHNLPVLWMSLLVFGFTYLVTAAIYVAVSVFAVGERARSFKAISPGLLSPLGIIFALFVAFTASQVWTDTEKAKAEIDREASALRTVVILASAPWASAGSTRLFLGGGVEHRDETAWLGM